MGDLAWVIDKVSPSPTRPNPPPRTRGPSGRQAVVTRSDPKTYIATRRKSQTAPPKP